MKKICTIFFFVVSNIMKAQVVIHVYLIIPTAQQSKDTIYYMPSQKLIWDDFKGSPINIGKIGAVTFSGFRYTKNWEYASKNDLLIININVFCFFSKPDSWVINEGETDYALMHEQHHFDISFIVANLFVTKLQESNFNFQNFDWVFNSVYQNCIAELRKRQDEYDQQTSHGRLKEIQDKWNEKINKELSLLK